MVVYEVVMKETRQTETVTIKACCCCSGGLLERDRFCRWCGARQTGEISSSKSLYTTTPLAGAGSQSSTLRPVSGPLVEAMLAGVSAGSSAPLYSRALRSVVWVLVSIPIWLMIVLLSPFDAYAAAKGISRHITSETATRNICEQKPLLGDFS